MPDFRVIDDIAMDGKTVLVRVDLNVPVEAGQVTDTTRIKRIVPTIKDIQAKGGLPVLLSHFGRPKGQHVEADSLRQVLPALEAALGQKVAFSGQTVGGEAKRAVAAMKPGDVLLLENTRFSPGEESNDPTFVASLAALGEIYINDAFSTAHRAHASTEGLARILPMAGAGRLMEAELNALSAALEAPQRPVAALVGGAKVSTKLELLANMLERVEHLIIGGGMANTFLLARGEEIGRSLAERDMIDTAREIMEKATLRKCTIHLPSDVVIAREFAANAPHEVVPADQCPEDAMILDAGPETLETISTIFAACRTLLWNGPLGAFETPPFDTGTNAAAQEAARLTREGQLVSIAGGGDTVAALNRADAAKDFTYISTAGGAFLEFIEGKPLPGVTALEEAARR